MSVNSNSTGKGRELSKIRKNSGNFISFVPCVVCNMTYESYVIIWSENFCFIQVENLENSENFILAKQWPPCQNP